MSNQADTPTNNHSGDVNGAIYCVYLFTPSISNILQLTLLCTKSPCALSVQYVSSASLTKAI